MFAGQVFSETRESSYGESYYVFSIGQAHCERLNKKLSDKKYNIAAKFYMHGYFTAANVTGSTFGFQLDQAAVDNAFEVVNEYCSKPENRDMWLADILNIYWRSQFKGFSASAKTEPKIMQ